MTDLLNPSADSTVEEIQVDDLIFDKKNANIGTDRGRETVRNSLTENGFGRSILIDKEGNIIAGNKTTEAAIKAGLKTVRVIKTTGNEIVAVQRTDLDIDSPEARRLAIADNRAAELGLQWDPAILSELTGDGVDITSYFTEVELQKVCESLEVEMPDDMEGDDEDGVDQIEDETMPGAIRQYNLFISEEHYEAFCDKVDQLIEKGNFDSATDCIINLVMRQA
jgi:sporulation protein YlmC with PRC-barrel domain